MSDVATIERALRRMNRKRRLVASVRAGVMGLSAAGAWLLTAALVDRWMPGPPRVRGATAIGTLILLAATGVRMALVIGSRAFDARAAALTAEANDAAWGERLSTVVTQAGLPVASRASPALNAAMAAAVLAELAQRPPARRVTFDAVRPAVSWFGGVVVAWGVAFAWPSVQLPTLVVRQLRPLADVPPATGTRIELLPHAGEVTQGQSLAIAVDVAGDNGTVTMWLGPDLSHLRPLTMDRAYGGRYTATLPALQDDFVYRVSAGDATTGPVAVRVLRTPGVAKLDVTLTYPDGRPPVTRADSDGRLRVAAGTRVDVTMRTTEAVRAATVIVGPRRFAATADPDRRTWRATFVADADMAWQIELTGKRGEAGGGPTGMRVRVD